MILYDSYGNAKVCEVKPFDDEAYLTNIIPLTERFPDMYVSISPVLNKIDLYFAYEETDFFGNATTKRLVGVSLYQNLADGLVSEGGFFDIEAKYYDKDASHGTEFNFKTFAMPSMVACDNTPIEKLLCDVKEKFDFDRFDGYSHNKNLILLMRERLYKKVDMNYLWEQYKTLRKATDMCHYKGNIIYAKLNDKEEKIYVIQNWLYLRGEAYPDMEQLLLHYRDEKLFDPYGGDELFKKYVENIGCKADVLLKERGDRDGRNDNEQLEVG